MQLTLICSVCNSRRLVPLNVYDLCILKHIINVFQQGLAVGDEVLEFGSVTATNFKTLQQIGEIVQHSLGVSISVSNWREMRERG